MREIDLLGTERRRSRRLLLTGGIEQLEQRTLQANGITPSAVAPIHGTVGVRLSNVEVASFTISDASAAPGTKWRAHMNWGDGTDCEWVQVTSLPDGSFEFLNSHTYKTPGTFRLKVNITVPGSGNPRANQVTTTSVIAAPTLTSISVDPINPRVLQGHEQQFMASGTYSNGRTERISGHVTWESSNPSVATFVRRQSVKALGEGTSTISATLGGVTGSTILTGISAPFKIDVTPENTLIPVGAGAQFRAVATYADKSRRTVTDEVQWSSSNESVARINYKGKGSALAIKNGTSEIVAQLDGVSSSATLTVAVRPSPPAELKSVEVRPANPSPARPGSSVQFRAFGVYTDHKTREIKDTAIVFWHSSNDAVAKIDHETGLATTLAPGTTTISLVVIAFNKKRYRTEITLTVSRG